MSAAIIPIIPMSREQVVYVDFWRYCRRLRIRPAPYQRWYELSEGRGFYDEDPDGFAFSSLWPNDMKGSTQKDVGAI
jgi:hypothetical protein